MIRKLVSSAIIMAVCIFSSCSDGGGGNGGDPVDDSMAITAFGFTSADNTVLSADVTGFISGTDISVTVPYGTTSIANLVATFATTGTSVKIGSTEQTSGTTANDFTSAKTYTVTAADGSTQDYTVTVTVASASAKAITAFSFPAVSFADASYTGNTYGTTISGTSITVKIPYGSTSMVATFATSGASITISGVPQVSGSTSNDFKNPVTYRVTAADGSTQDYTVTALFAPAVGCNLVTGKSSYWLTTTSTTTDAISVMLGLTCDAINAGSDNFTMFLQVEAGLFSPNVASGLIVPSDTTANNYGDERTLTIVGPLTSIKSVIAQLEYIPPAEALSGFYIHVKLTDKNGLKAWGRIDMTVNEPSWL